MKSTDKSLVPQKIWIVTGESFTQEIVKGARGSEDEGGLIGDGFQKPEIESLTTIKREPVELEKLKQEMKGFLAAMREMLDEADPPDSKMRLEEVVLSVEINGEGKVSLLGIGGKAGGKGAMTFKFKRSQK
ncbi:hypothetical protein PCC7424_0669 [Gloeothece citriformis PCC 7424]|uniref:Pepco domain-containing protein n=1 Tax=Gloeothece citriformis (strain PCC 7424) TaxID=65393 RepID=B7KEV3_GLOC7|nr:hypothetical protein [Gloeothece citriformis]ACK69128.1 hypothetical protein PCC7424_0669 [Gloeothece citriformis PCC 7424]